MVPLTVNGVQARLDEARSGILSAVWAKAGPPAQAARAAPATSPARLADFNAEIEIICSLICNRARTHTCRPGRRAGTHTPQPIEGARRMGPCLRRDDRVDRRQYAYASRKPWEWLHRPAILRALIVAATCLVQ